MRRRQEADLLAGFHPAQPDTFEPVVLAYQDRLVAFARRLLGNAADAEEVVQDAFVRAFRHLQRRPRETWGDIELTPWLYRITLNVCRTYGKARARRRTEELPADGALPGAEECAAAVALGMALEAALGRLPAHYRTVVLLRYVHQLTYEEVACVLGRPLGTVKASVHRGTRLLRQLLASSLGEGG